MAEALLIDLGGTHCRIGQIPGQPAEGVRAPHATARYALSEFADLPALISHHITRAALEPITQVCAGVAGPVHGSTAQLTNHTWQINADEIAQITGAQSVHLLNDLQAQAYALDDVPPKSLSPLLPGTPDPIGPRIVLGLGTGCNIAVAHRTHGTLFVPPSESGHTTLPDAPGFRPVFDALRQEMPHLPVEAALSGPGLMRLHLHLSGEHLSPEDIVQQQPRKTLQTFVSLLGLTASNLCLSHMSTGGLYLIGGVARAIAPFLTPMGFADTFHPRGPYTHILQRIPVNLITDDTAALRGCARFLAQRTRT